VPAASITDARCEGLKRRLAFRSADKAGSSLAEFAVAVVDHLVKLALDLVLGFSTLISASPEVKTSVVLPPQTGGK